MSNAKKLAKTRVITPSGHDFIHPESVTQTMLLVYKVIFGKVCPTNGELRRVLRAKGYSFESQ